MTWVQGKVANLRGYAARAIVTALVFEKVALSDSQAWQFPPWLEAQWSVCMFDLFVVKPCFQLSIHHQMRVMEGFYDGVVFSTSGSSWSALDGKDSFTSPPLTGDKPCHGPCPHDIS